VLLITKDLGGKTNYRLQLPDIEHHLVINGEEVVNRFVNEIDYLDFAREMEAVESVERIPDGYGVRTRGGKEYTAGAVILATGANSRRLGVPGEKQFIMRGLCYSAMSYASLFSDRTVIVVGDSGRALSAVAELARIAKHITLVAPTHGELSGPLGRRLRTLPHVVILEGYQVTQVNGDDYARSLVVAKNGDTHELWADAMFIELGLVPNSKLVAEWVECDAEGRIQIDTHNRTSAPGLFAAGDVTNAYAEQVLIALGEGAKAALSAYEYLLEHPVAEMATAAAGEWR
jgi:thioredoxin reductase